MPRIRGESMRNFVEYHGGLAAHFEWAILIVPLIGQALLGQTMLTSTNGMVRIIPTDSAVLEMQEVRKDLVCTVTPAKAPLGFDLRFHSGYEVNVPMKELAGAENLLTILFRVTSEERKEEPTYFIQRMRVPEIEENASGSVQMGGLFDLGAGKYHVDWLMRDRSERVCSFYWDLEATLPPKDASITVAIPPTEIRLADEEHFKEEPPVERADNAPLNVKVLLNYAPQNSSSAIMRTSDTTALVSILRSIFRDPRITKFSLVAFNLHERRVLFKQDNADRIDFPKLGEAVSKVKLATTDLARLSNKRGEIEFLTGLVQSELAAGDRPDAIIFAGPKTLVDAKIEPEILKELGTLTYPVFYLNYNLYPQVNPWRDAISHAVKHFKGQEYTISRPRDLWFATTEMVENIVKQKSDKQKNTRVAIGGGE